ncbi:MAG TPA: hypothetical protein VNX88_22475 [Terriglobales bacterium]|nr:hypothetical protein [Terriglobales bacterium]
MRERRRLSELQDFASYDVRKLLTGSRVFAFERNMIRTYSRLLAALFLTVPTLLVTSAQAAESCYTAPDMEASARMGIESAVQQLFSAAAAGNTAAMQQNSIAAIANNFQGITNVVQANKDKIAGGQARIRNEWVLDAPGTTPYQRAEFYCGTFNSLQRSSFVIPGLPPGKYAVAIQDVTGSKQPFTITYILQQEGSQWKLAGYYAKPRQVGPHDGLWYWVQARDFKKRGSQHVSFFYYLTAADLLAPVNFMSTPQLEKLYEEQQAAIPKDIPQNPQQPVPLTLNGYTYNIVQAFVVPDEKQGLNLVYKYSSPDISDQVKTFQQNMAFIKALAQQYPEYKQAFTSIVARAVGPNGQDFGTQLPVNDIK